MRSALLLPFLLLLAACASAPRAEERNLSSEDPLRWQSQGAIEVGNLNDELYVVRADLRRAALELVNPPETNGLTVTELARQRGYAVVINAAMFATDYVTSIGYMRNFGNINNPRLSGKLKGFLLFNPKDPKLPAVKVGSKEDLAGYQTAFQTHRMWAEGEGILWKAGASYFHHVGLVGVDGQGRVLFFYHPGYTDVYAMVDRILHLGLNLRGLLYLDGGYHGAFYLAPEHGGGWHTGLNLPNLLGLRAEAQ